MVSKKNFLYKLLCFFEKTVRFSSTYLPSEVFFEIEDDDIQEVQQNDGRFILRLSDAGLLRLKSVHNTQSQTLMRLMYVDRKSKLVCLSKNISLKDMLYNSELIWAANNQKDLLLQTKALKKFIR